MEHTIAAISTSTMSSGGISIVRMSGKDAIETADKIFVSKNGKKLSEASSHTVHYGNIVDEDGNIIDEVLVIVMRAPNTYTREDVVEIDCHGGILVTRKVLVPNLHGLQLAQSRYLTQSGSFKTVITSHNPA